MAAPTIAQSIATVRQTLVDLEAGNYRYTDAELLAYYQDGLREVCVYRPDEFAQFTTMQCVEGVEQTAPADAQVLIDVLGVVDGDEITEADYAAFRAWNPAWRSVPAGPAEMWMRVPSDSNKRPDTKFFVYPAAVGAGQSLRICIATLSGVSALNVTDVCPIAERYVPALEAYMIFRAESKDDEHVVGERAALFRTGFEALLGIGSATKKVKP